MDIQWYPGHMAKATRLIKEQLKNIDVVILTGDARCVKTSINTDFLPVIQNKRSCYVFTKTDLADPSVTQEWKNHFGKTGEVAFFVDLINKKGLDSLNAYLLSLKESFRFNREVHILAAGIPNVGKSMLINALSGRAAAQTGNIPGVTRANKWVRLNGDYYLLDTPGILPPKFETQAEGVMLAAIGCVKDTVFDKGELSLKVIEFMAEKYPQKLMDRYKLTDIDKTPNELLDDIALKRGFIMRGGIPDYDRCVNTVLDEFKNGLIGAMSFEKPSKE